MFIIYGLFGVVSTIISPKIPEIFAQLLKIKKFYCNQSATNADFTSRKFFLLSGGFCYNMRIYFNPSTGLRTC